MSIEDLGRLTATVRGHPDDREKALLLGSACRRLTKDATDDKFYNLGGSVLYTAALLDDLVLVNSVIHQLHQWTWRIGKFVESLKRSSARMAGSV